MRIYFAANNSSEEKLRQRYDKIINILSNAGILVMSNLANEKLASFSDQDLEKIDQAGEVLLEKMDGLIIEESRPIAESGYLIALALAHHKPILYLLEKGKTVNKNLLHLKNDKTTSKLLSIQYYNEAGLEKTIISFLKTVEQGDGGQAPTIKFTLRITPKIERYLHWKTHNTEFSKADFLRQQIEELINKDKDYQKFSD